jgi:hypothetical protein
MFFSFVQICFAADKQISVGDFSADVANKLTIRYKGKIIVNYDNCDDSGNELLNTEKGVISRNGNSYTLFNENATDSFRREVTVKQNQVEITFRILIRRPIRSHVIYYRLHCPKNVFNGSQYDYVSGWVNRKPKTGSGTFGAEKKLQLNSVRYLRLKSKVSPLTFDFNPEGPWLCYGGDFGRLWGCSILAKDNEYQITRGRAYANFGNLMLGKIIIRSGQASYSQIHPCDHLCYTTNMPETLVLNMSNDRDRMEYKSCNPKSELKNANWQHPEKLKIEKQVNQDFVYCDFIKSANREDGVLEIKNQVPGLYWLTLTVFDSQADTGPFTVSANKQLLVDNVKIKGNKYWIKTIPLWIKTNSEKIRFSGNWKLNALVLQLIMGEKEDYLFNRGYWNMKNRQKNKTEN